MSNLHYRNMALAGTDQLRKPRLERQKTCGRLLKHYRQVTKSPRWGSGVGDAVKREDL